MASTRSSPVMVEQPSSPPAHPFPSAELTTSTTTAIEPAPSNSASNNTNPSAETSTTSASQEGSSDSAIQAPEAASTTEEQTTTAASEHDEDAEEDNSSNSESHSDSSTSTETPGTISTPRSSAHDSGQPPVPDAESALLNPNPESLTTETSTTDQPESQTSQDSTEGLLIPPPPIADIVPVPDPVPSWVLYEEDTSEPTKEELETIEANKNELNASDPNAIEKDVFYDLDDPDQRPHKKIRLSWVIKGVRGTKEKPNRARIMTSPSVCIDGNHWNLKFFPRGNKSRNSLAVFLRCSPAEPLPQSENLEGSFRCWEGAHDADFSKAEPLIDLELKLPEPVETEEEDKKLDEPAKTSETLGDVAAGEPAIETAVVTDSESSEPVEEQSQIRRRDSRDDDDSSVSGDEDDRPLPHLNPNTMEDYRLSAQLGLAVYNPAEPRTCYTSSASHQFYPHQDDWGWDTAVSYWEDIHHRRSGQRQALLRNDTLAVDAYIRVYDDPTKALYWHSSPGETQWDAKGLAGVFPVGTRLLYHSPATAGIIAWTMLAPFRQAIQNIDAGLWRKDSAAKPRPLFAHMQLMLFQMRHMKKEELYVRLDNVIHEITRSGESFDNVKAFWEAWRRSLEMETLDNPELSQALTKIFGNRAQLRTLPTLPIKDVSDFQDSASKAFDKASYKEPLPDFLPLTLQRQSFDSATRQWKLHHDLVKISEEVDLSKHTSNDDDKYSLYGFIVHDGERTSGKFFSVLRPNGPGGKWLVFSDGNGNKVFSYTRKQIDAYQGLEGPELKKAANNRQTIHTAMYLRTSRLSEYLTDSLEPYKLASWLKPHLDEAYNQADDQFTEPEGVLDDVPVDVELFWDRSVSGQEGKLDLYKLKSHDKARQKENRQILTADRDATIGDVKTKLATLLDIDQKAFKLWAMNHHRLGGVSKGYMYVLPDHSIVRSCLNTSLHLTLWFTVVPDKHELEPDMLAANFLKIEGAHIEAPPKPEPPAEVEEPKPPTTTENEDDTNAATGVEAAGSSEEPVVASDEAAPDEEQRAIEEAITRSLALLPPGSEDVVPGINNANIPPATESSPLQVAAADEEQQSVREAVEQTVANTGGAISEGRSVSTGNTEHESTTSAPSESTVQEPPTSTEATSEMQAAAPTEAEVTTTTTTAAAGVAALAADLLPNAESTQTLPVTPSEPASGNVPTSDGILGNLDSSEDALHDEPQLTLTESHDAPLGHGEPPLPIGIPIAIGDHQILLIQPNAEIISSEDAALISSLIAADLEAAERDGQAANEENDEIPADPVTEGENEAVDSRPITPRQHVPDVYGFIHVFDAENQKFTACGTFMVPRDTTISAMIRKQMAYDDEKSFHLWKRDGTYRTVGVSLESTFQDASLTDCCEVIVGDQLSELKIEALKAEAKYVDPGQLMRYIAMAQRGHPVSAFTSEESVEISEFGGDYYKGCLVRGQRHGKECYVITQAGDTYEGPLIAGQKSGGKGKMTYQNGDVYDGEWSDDQKHGQGEFVEKRTGNKYVGGYENDKRWGKGVTYWEQADQQAALCQVCYYEEVDALFYKCGHVVACYACAKQCAADSNGCPVCRKPIEAVVKMYRA